MLTAPVNFIMPARTIHLLFYLIKPQKIWKQKWLQFLFVVKATALKEKISNVYVQIKHRSQPAFIHLWQLLTDINVIASMLRICWYNFDICCLKPWHFVFILYNEKHLDSACLRQGMSYKCRDTYPETDPDPKTDPDPDDPYPDPWSRSPPKCNHLFINPLPTFPKNFMQNRFGSCANLLTDRQTDKQTNNDESITSLAEIINDNKK